VVASHQVLHRDDDGKQLAVIEVNNDITEQKLAEEALRESEKRFRTMVDAISQLAWIAQPDGYIFWYNQRWYEYTGTTPEQMEGWGWQSVHDPEMLPAVLERWKASIAAGEPFDMEFPLLGADGKFRAFLTRGVPIKDSEGRVVRWCGTNTDVSEARELEAHKRDFYRRTILAATEGKLMVSERQEIEKYAGPAVETWDIRCTDDAGSAINRMVQLVREAGMEEKRARNFQGCVTEAVTNVFKHAVGGRVSLHKTEDHIICVVADSGPGIAALALPDVALTRGYSTAGTLGMGYKVMIHFADRVHFSTGPDGTTVAIEMKLHED
jgi:PAS domain S-box-containing protein